MTTAAFALREAIIARLSDLPGYRSLPRRVPLPQQQPNDLPQLSVFIMSERLTPDGDANAGAVDFVAEVVIGISDMRGFATPDVLDGQNDAAVDEIEMRLLCDPTFTEMSAFSLFEAVTGITRRRIYPQDGETYFAELRLEMTFQARVSFEPLIPDQLRHVILTTRPDPADSDTPAIRTRIDVAGT